MTYKIVFVALFLLTGCVENLINISILNDGSYVVKYTSIGNKSDLIDIDFKHPENDNTLEWITSLINNTDSENENIWEKETILSSPTKQKLVFTNSSSLQYDIDVRKKSFFLWTNYYFSSNVKNLEIDKKYPEIGQYLNIDQEDIDWMIPVKRYIFLKSIEIYSEKYTLDQLTVERLDNQLNTYISYIEEKKLEKDLNINASTVFFDAIMPIENQLPSRFISEMTMIINKLEKEFEKNTSLMSDNFTFSVIIPGNVKDSNANNEISDNGSLYWEFDYNDIATNSFNMYAHSVVINKLLVQLSLLIFLLFFIKVLWKNKQKKE